MNDNYKETINITIRTFKPAKGPTYSDIYVNGHRIITHHLKTRVKTFLDDTVLGIYGIMSDNAYIDKTPQWVVYNNQQMQPLILDALEKPNLQKTSANIIKLAQVKDILHLITDTRAYLWCKKSPDANYMFKVTHERIK